MMEIEVTLSRKRKRVTLRTKRAQALKMAIEITNAEFTFKKPDDLISYAEALIRYIDCGPTKTATVLKMAETETKRK